MITETRFKNKSYRNLKFSFLKNLIFIINKLIDEKIFCTFIIQIQRNITLKIFFFQKKI
jgi:hypothetical protein